MECFAGTVMMHLPASVRVYRRRPQTSSLLPWKRGRSSSVPTLAPEREELLQSCIREFYLTPERLSLFLNQ
jgi:hypothetical protein